MAIKGSLKEASLPDVLQLLSLGQKSGCLSLNDRSNLGYIYFDRGRITFASIVNRRDRFGDLLVKHGKISRDQLENVIEKQDMERDKKLGQLLLETGAITREELEQYVAIQVEEAVYYLFTWTQGSFRFDADVKPDREDVTLSINPESLLLEGARRVDEWSLIEKKIPSMQLVFMLERDRLKTSDVDLTNEQQTVIGLLDGNRDLAQIVEDSGLSEFEVGKAVYGLITAGFVHRVRRQEQSRSSQAVVEARVAEHRNLGVAFYKTGMLEEAAREFRQVVELEANDANAHFFIGLVAAKQEDWADAERAFKRAIEMGGPQPNVLYNAALSLEQLGKFEEAEALYGDAVSRARMDVRALTAWGAVALRMHKYEEALGRLARAAEVAGEQPLPVMWYWARSLLAAAQEEYDAAQQYLRDGIEHYPDEVVLRNNLAALLELVGETEEAEQVIRQAEGDGLQLPQLFKNLGDLLYRAGRHDDAWDAYQRAVKVAAELGDDVYFKLGNIAYKRMDRDAAATLWQKTLELNPEHQLARTNIDTMSALR